MSSPLSNISQISSGEGGRLLGNVGKGSAKLPFAELVNGLLNETNAQQLGVEESVKQLVTGETDSIHDVVLSASQADLAFRLVMEIRDQLITSYQEVMRMQV